MNAAIITLLVEKNRLSEQRKVIQKLYKEGIEASAIEFETDSLLDKIAELEIVIIEHNNAIKLLLETHSTP